MQRYRAVHFTKYIHTGFVILILTLTFLFCLTYKFKDPIGNMDTYLTDICMITDVKLRIIKYNCWQGNFARIIDMPCLKVTGNTINYKNITFYRSVTEKTNANPHQVSYFNPFTIIKNKGN